MKKFNRLGDDMLIEAYCQNNSEKAALALYKRYEPLIKGLIHKTILNYDEQQDLIQEAGIKIFQNLASSYNEQGKFKQWVTRITTNIINDHLRRKTSAPRTVSYDFNALPALYSDDPKKILRMEKIYEIQNKVIQELPPDCQTLLKKVYIENKSYSEIAKELDISKSGSHKRMKSIIPKIEKAMREQGVNESDLYD